MSSMISSRKEAIPSPHYTAFSILDQIPGLLAKSTALAQNFLFLDHLSPCSTQCDRDKVQKVFSSGFVTRDRTLGRISTVSFRKGTPEETVGPRRRSLSGPQRLENQKQDRCGSRMMLLVRIL